MKPAHWPKHALAIFFGAPRKPGHWAKYALAFFLGVFCKSILLMFATLAVEVLYFFLPELSASTYSENERHHIMNMATDVKKLMEGNYAGLDNELAYKSNIFPKAMISHKSRFLSRKPRFRVSSAWGSPVSLAPATDPAFFTITYEMISPEPCRYLIPGLLQDFESVSLGSIVLTSSSTPAEAVNACNAGNQPLVITSD